MENTKKKLMLVVESMGGGVFTYMVSLANQMCQQYEVYILYATRLQTPTDYKLYFDESIHLIHIEHFTRSIHVSQDVKAYFELRKHLKAIKPDIVHLHSSKAGALGRLLKMDKNVPLFYTPHGYSFLMEDAGVAKRAVYQFIERLLGMRNCLTIACSEGEYTQAKRITKQVTYINNGVKLETIECLLNDVGITARYETKQRQSVFTIGRICEQKNPAMFEKIAQRMPDVAFVWIGDGELRHQLRSPNIEVTGWVSRTEALVKASSADIFLLPSLWEGLPIALLEAMAMKKLCVVSNVEGNRDVIRSGANGYICESLEEYLQVLNDALKHNNRVLLEQAYKDIQTIYDIDVIVQRYIALYEKRLKECR